MSNCGTCQHWLEHDPAHPLDGFGGCSRLRRGMFSPEPDIANEIAVVVDAGGLETMLKCKDEFGCVLWEAVPPPEGGP